MPGSDYAQLAASLLAEGLSPETACVVISAVSRDTQAVHRTTLGNLPDIGPLSAPALLLAGDVLESREEFGQEFMEQVVAMANSIDL
jgi:siroheme synthase